MVSSPMDSVTVALITPDHDAVLTKGLERLNLTAPPDLVARLLGYVELLGRWNRAYNLTSITDTDAMIRKHVLDSLAALPFLHGDRIVDVGSGAGLPGLVMAMARPGLRFVVLDSAGKKTRFMAHAVRRLGLANVEVVHARAEDYAPASGFDTVISRAFASLIDFVRLAGHLAASDGRLLAMKGRLENSGLQGLPSGWSVAGVHRLTVPGLDADRHLVELVRAPGEQDQ